MLATTLAGTNPHILSLTAATEVLAGKQNPFTALNKVFLQAPATPTIYGINRVPESLLQINNQGGYGLGSTSKPRYLRIVADGAATTWNSTDYPALINLHNDAGAITNAIRLATVLVVNGLIKHRVQSDATPGASEWKAAESGGVYTLTAKSAADGAYAAGTILEVYMGAVGDIVTQGPLVANVPIEGVCYDFMLATTVAIMSADRV